jgi:hypothetical protein
MGTTRSVHRYVQIAIVVVPSGAQPTATPALEAGTESTRDAGLIVTPARVQAAADDPLAGGA